VTPQGIDPLGKRALYWMPVDSRVVVAKDTDREEGVSRGNDVPRPPTGRRRARPAGKHALYSTATAPSEDDAAGFTDIGADPLPLRGLLAVECSACGSVTRVSVLDFLMLQFPFGAWVPGRTFDHRMTCPACRRRTWTSVTLSSSMT
jgi:hypothetical protein